ncbi:hypothetical protein CHS0354_039197 [Potamilus streckersoni]|uniref:Saposin B-type domain-containing protein n=1 Tax=Potamilus streckersoni TaxID=2493646 RepID=A0AAE0TEE4_9BIVA|nr:hypothetical protein CHS0354_039197 [Potamilus streckersoni]
MEGWIFALVIIIGAVSGAPSYDTGHDAVLCDVCHVVVEQVKALINKEQTKEKAISYLENVCIQLPGAEKELCRDFIHSKSPKVLTELISQLDSMEVCFMLPNVCSRRKQEVPLLVEEPVILKSEPVHENVQDTLECEICKYIVTTLDGLVGENKTEAAINATLTKICQSLPGALGQLCMQIEPNLLKVLENGFDPQKACTAVKLCTSVLVEETKEEPVILKSEPVPENMQDTLECEICKYIVTTLDGLVGENKTEAAINATLTKICQSLPGALGQLCMQIEPNLLKVLENGFDPQKACTAVKLCTSVLVEETKEEPVILKSEPVPENMQDTLECEICKYIVTTLDGLVGENKTEAAINATLTKICQSLPGALGQLCMQVEPNLLKVLENGFDPQKACTAVKLCTSAGKKLDLPCDFCYTFLAEIGVKDAEKICSVMDSCQHETDIKEENDQATYSEEPEDDLECNLCKFIVSSLDQLLGNNKTEAAINSTLMKICNSLPGELGQICMQAEPNLVKALENGFDPEKACKAIKMCNSGVGKSINPAHIPCDVCQSALKMVAGEKGVEACFDIPGVCLYDGEVEIKTPANIKHEPAKADAKCELCKFIVDLLEYYVAENATEEKINNTLNSICNSLPEDTKEMCQGAAQAIVKLLKDGVDPATACQLTKFCSASSSWINLSEMECDTCHHFLVASNPETFTEEVTNLLCNQACHQRQRRSIKKKTLINKFPGVNKKGKLQNSTPLNADIKCDLCRFAVTELDSLLGQNRTDAAINSTLNSICAELPKELSLLCKMAIPSIMKAVENGFDPDKACTAAKLCNEPVVLMEKVTANEESDISSIGCDICEFLVAEADTILKENKSKDVLNATLFKVCDQLPAEIKLTCEVLVPQIVIVLSNGANPKKACSSIHLCTGSNDVHILQGTQHNKPQEKKPEDSLLCELCQLLVTEGDKELQQNKTIAALNSTLYKTCAKLPKSYALFCDLLVPEIVSLLAKGFSPKNVCIEMHLCTNSSTAMENPDEDPFSAAVKSLAHLAPRDCQLCRKVMEFVNGDLIKNYEKIRGFIVGNVCNKLPHPTSLACTDMAKTKLEKVWEAVLSKMSSDQLCKLGNLC